MKRIIVLLMIIAVVSVAATAQTDDSAITYDLAAESFAEMLTVLDQAIYLVATAASGGTGQFMRGELQEYAQAVINLLEGPESELFDDGNDLAMVPTVGLIPLMDGLRSWSGGPAYQELYPSRPYGHLSNVLGYRTAWDLVDAALQKASDVAQSMIRPLYTFPWEQELAVLYALFVSARGGDSVSFPLGGVESLAQLFPLREIWVDAGESIQAALDRVPDGGTVYIPAGVYREALVVNKNVNIVAASHAPNGLPELGRTILEGLLWRASIEVSSSAPIDVSVRGLIFRNSAVAIAVDGACNVTLFDVLVEDSDAGLYVTNAAVITAEACRFNRTEMAITLHFGAFATLRDCVIENSPPSSHVIQFWCSRLELDNCDIRDNQGTGVSVGAGVASELHMINSRILRNSQGMEVSYGACALEARIGSQSAPLSEEGYGTITGWANTIPGPGEKDGNTYSVFGSPPFPPRELDLTFLTQPKPEDE